MTISKAQEQAQVAVQHNIKMHIAKVRLTITDLLKDYPLLKVESMAVTVTNEFTENNLTKWEKLEREQLEKTGSSIYIFKHPGCCPLKLVLGMPHGVIINCKLTICENKIEIDIEQVFNKIMSIFDVMEIQSL